LHISQEIKANIASQRWRLMPSSPQELKSNGKNKQIENFQLLLDASTSYNTLCPKISVTKRTFLAQKFKVRFPFKRPKLISFLFLT